MFLFTGARFNLKDFHDACLHCGQVPLSVLETYIKQFVQQQKCLTDSVVNWGFLEMIQDGL